MNILLKKSIDSVVKTLLVAGLLLGSVWILVRIAAWEPEKPALLSEGTLVLSAKAAILHGDGIRFETLDGVEDVGWWDFDTQWLSWETDIEKAGEHRVILRYSRPGSSSVKLDLAGGGTVLHAVAAGTGGWKQWKSIDLGCIDLSAGKGQTFTLKAIDPPGKGVINFAGLELVPVEAP